MNPLMTTFQTVWKVFNDKIFFDVRGWGFFFKRIWILHFIILPITCLDQISEGLGWSSLRNALSFANELQKTPFSENNCILRSGRHLTFPFKINSQNARALFWRFKPSTIKILKRTNLEQHYSASPSSAPDRIESARRYATRKIIQFAVFILKFNVDFLSLQNIWYVGGSIAAPGHRFQS